MTGLNHAVTGALVATAIADPLIALPAALLSHFAIDMLPHWDYYRATTSDSKRWLNGAIDLTVSICVLIILALTVNAPAWLIIVGGLLGILPDAMWISYLIWRSPSIKGNPKSPINLIRRAHMRIQWLETPGLYGLFAEIIWLCLTTFLIYKIN